MALTNALTAIANAIRQKNGSSKAMSMGEMVSAINNLKTTFSTQSKTVTPTKNEQTVECDSNYDGLSSVKINAIPSEYIVPSGSQTLNQNKTYDVTSLAQVIVNVAGGGLPSGISAIDVGTYTKSNSTTTAKFTVSHNLGVVPDLVMFWTPTNIATTYSMLCAIRYSGFAWRGSAYSSWYAYHGNSTTTATFANSNSTSYGISNMTSSSFQVQSHSTSYYWRANTYKWIAIKFA